MDEGIESMSLNPDTVIETWLELANWQGALSREACGDLWKRCAKLRVHGHQLYTERVC
jgi:hypothetical protein